MRRVERYTFPLAVVAAAAAAGAGAYLVARGITEPTPRQRAVAERGAAVMRFDLGATTHHFVPLPDGGIVRVVADDPEDRQQVVLVRRHLAREADAFSSGDYSDPMRIHGEEMPGVELLRRRHDDIEVSYTLLRTGAAITFETEDEDLVAALHAWLEAQTGDHGSHAEHS